MQGRQIALVDRSLHLVVVGRARLRNPALLAGSFATTGAVAVQLGPSVAAMRGLTALELFPRTYGWVVPIDTSSLRQDTPQYNVRTPYTSTRRGVVSM